MSGPPLTVPAQPALACSSGRIVRNRLTTAPGPDPVPPAAQLRASTVNAGHPVAVSTAACGQRCGGGPAHDRLFTSLVRPLELTGDLPPRHISRPTPLRANQCVPSSVHARTGLAAVHRSASSGARLTLETGAVFWFSRTFDEDGPSPVRHNRESPGKRGPLRRLTALYHRECGRTGNQRQC
jgi:hypothetical protein